MTDHAIGWLQTQQSLTPDKPFFVYYAAPGTHAPVQVPAAWRDKYKGQFDQGWDRAREQTLARQKELGIVPPDTELAAKPGDVMPDWDDLSPDEKKVCARHQELMAAFAEVTDHEIGRVVQAIDDLGALDNTLIIYITGDNGATENGGPLGWYNTFASYNQVPETLDDQLEHLEDFGAPESVLTPPLGWTVADNTPFAYGRLRAVQRRVRRHHQRCRAQLAQDDQGSRGDPRPVSPRHRHRSHCAGRGRAATPRGGLRRRTATHRRGRHELLLTDAQATSPHTVQYFEFAGNRGIYKDGWYASTLHKVPWEPGPRNSYDDDDWELFHTTEDFSCAKNLAAEHPAKLKELQDTFLAEAIKHHVLPLDDRFNERMISAIAGRPDLMEGRTTLTVYPGMVGMKENAFIDVKNRSSSITAELQIPPGGASGVVLSQGGMHAGWSLYLTDSVPKFAYNFLGHVTTIAADQPLSPGPVTLTYEFAYDGGTPGSGGTATLSADQTPLATGRIERTIPFVFGVETADVGTDLYSPVTPDYPQGDNTFTGTINKIRIDLK